MEHYSEQNKMPTYYLQNESETPIPGTLPYHWDGDAHLVINENFYSTSLLDDEAMESNFPDFSTTETVESMKDVLPEPDYTMLGSGSFLSTIESSSDNGLQTPSEESQVENIDAKIDFIIETTKKPPKGACTQKRKKGRKTQAQLEILQKELGNVKNADKSLIKAVALKTGLKEVQVYKWYWDRKPKGT